MIPLFVLALLRVGSHPGSSNGALVVYTDYSSAIYCAVILGPLVAVRPVRVSSFGLAASRALFVIAGAALVLSAVIATTAGFVLEFGGIRASMRTARNPLNVAWICFVLGWCCGHRCGRYGAASVCRERR